nr:unnamed protein product [Callosobruchus analis]
MATSIESLVAQTDADLYTEEIVLNEQCSHHESLLWRITKSSYCTRNVKPHISAPSTPSQTDAIVTTQKKGEGVSKGTLIELNNSKSKLGGISELLQATPTCVKPILLLMCEMKPGWMQNCVRLNHYIKFPCMRVEESNPKCSVKGLAKAAKDAISKVINGVSRNIGTQAPIICLFIGPRKAFDTVNHAQLLDRLEEVNFSGIPIF